MRRPSVVIPQTMKGKIVTFYTVAVDAGRTPLVKRGSSTEAFKAGFLPLSGTGMTTNVRCKDICALSNNCCYSFFAA